MKRLSRAAAPLFWSLAAAQAVVGILEGTYVLIALGAAQGADLSLSGRSPLERGTKGLLAALFGPAAFLTMLCAALALLAEGAPPGRHPLSLWLAAGSAVLAGVWWRSLHPAGVDLASVAMRTLFALGALAGGEFGWDWADPLGGLLLANIPLRTAWSAAVDALGATAAPDGPGSATRRRKSA